MPPSTIKSLLNQKSADSLTYDQLIDRIFANLVEVLKTTEMYPAEFFIPDLLHGEDKVKINLWRASVRDTVKDIFPQGGDEQLARMALDMNKGALDYCCGLIVENFLRQNAIEAEELAEVIDSMMEERHAERLSKQERARILQNVRSSFPAYQSLKYLAAAGPVFGFPVDDIYKEEISQQCASIINKAIEVAIDGPQGPEVA